MPDEIRIGKSSAPPPPEFQPADQIEVARLLAARLYPKLLIAALQHKENDRSFTKWTGLSIGLSSEFEDLPAAVGLSTSYRTEED